MKNRTSDYVISLTETDDDPDREFIWRQLMEYNINTLPRYYVRGLPVPVLNVYFRNEDDRIIGGSTAEIHWDSLHIDYLWVDDRERGKGLGTRLMRYLEAEAQARGCRWSTLTTFDFQARGFYEKLGYRVIGQLDDYPPEHTYYFMRKDFA